jgi:hypothetical protein
MEIRRTLTTALMAMLMCVVFVGYAAAILAPFWWPALEQCK